MAFVVRWTVSAMMSASLNATHFQRDIVRTRAPYASNCTVNWAMTDLNKTYMADEKPLYSLGVIAFAILRLRGLSDKPLINY